MEQIIIGLRSADKRRNLIAKTELTLKSAIDSIRAYEITTKDNSRYKVANQEKNEIYHVVSTKNKPCTRCGRHHKNRKENCYAFNKTCRRCNGLHHFEQYCLTNQQGRKNPKEAQNCSKTRQGSEPNRYKKHFYQKKKSTSKEDEDDESYENTESFLYTIGAENDNRDEIFTNIDCEDAGNKKHKLRMKVDTGANRNILPVRIFKRMYENKYGCLTLNKLKNGPREITPRYRKQDLWAANGTKIIHHGSIILKIKHKNSATIKQSFSYVTVTPQY